MSVEGMCGMNYAREKTLMFTHIYVEPVFWHGTCIEPP